MATIIVIQPSESGKAASAEATQKWLADPANAQTIAQWRESDRVAAHANRAGDRKGPRGSAVWLKAANQTYKRLLAKQRGPVVVHHVASHGRETRRAPARPTTTATKASGSDPPPSSDDDPAPPALLVADQFAALERAIIQNATPIAKIIAALFAAIAPAPPPDHPIVVLRDGCPELGLTKRQLLDAHRAGAFEAAGRPLVARQSAIVAWLESRLAAPPRGEEPAPKPTTLDVEGGRPRGKLRAIGGGRGAK